MSKSQKKLYFPSNLLVISFKLPQLRLNIDIMYW